MNILIIGGTRFLGLHAAFAALRRGHRVTMFHRGKTAGGGVPGCESIIGDRTKDLSPVFNAWDAVIDTCGYLPRDVRASTESLRAAGTKKYLFVSSVNAFAEPLPRLADETAPRDQSGDMDAVEMILERYGPLKAACETVAEEIFEDDALVVRPGLIVGPNDPTDRFTYWVRRIADGGNVLVPEPQNRNVQCIDVRDLAQWMVQMLEEGVGGLFNATGPGETMAEIVRVCKEASKANAAFHWAPEQFLLEQNIEPWSDMPLWIPGPDGEIFDSISSAKARSNGLTHRPLYETVHDTLTWDRTRDRTAPLKAGITRERESVVLEALALRTGSSALTEDVF